jgi:hypothetical protein
MADHMKRIGDPEFVIVWLVGEVDRLMTCPAQDLARAVDIADQMAKAFRRLEAAGYLLQP